MNFNLYLDRLAAERLSKLAKIRKVPGNALIRQAVDDWLARETPKWPEILLDCVGDDRVVPFESHRKELASANVDPFDSGKGTLVRPTVKRVVRRKRSR